MSKRDRFAYAALGLVVGLGLAFLFLIWAVPEFAEPVEHAAAQSGEEYQRRTTGGDEQANEPQWWYWAKRLIATEDTLAQWVMAFFGVAATVISYRAVVLIRETLDLNRQATDAAVIAANAAVEGLGAERAWLTWSGVRTESHTNITHLGVTYPVGVIFSVSWTNNGRSPALKATVFGDKILIGPNDDVPTFKSAEVENKANGSVVGPNMEVFSPQMLIVGNDHIELFGRLKRAVLYSQVFYSDVFKSDVIRESECCISITYKGRQINPDGTTKDLFDVMPVGHQNGAT